MSVWAGITPPVEVYRSALEHETRSDKESVGLFSLGVCFCRDPHSVEVSLPELARKVGCDCQCAVGCEV